MQASVRQDNLQQAIKQVARALPARGTNYLVLNHIHLSASEPNELQVAACDLEMGIIAHVPARVEQIGACTVPGRTLNDMLPLLDGPIDISTHTHTTPREQQTAAVTMQCGNNRMTTYHSDPDEYPIGFTAISPRTSWDMPRDQLIAILDRTIYAAPGGQRHRLAHVYLAHNGTRLTVYASDGELIAADHWLCKAEPFNASLRIGPAKSLLSSLRQAEGEHVSVSMTERGMLAVKTSAERDGIRYTFMITADTDASLNLSAIRPTTPVTATIAMNITELKTVLKRLKAADTVTLIQGQPGVATAQHDSMSITMAAQWTGLQTSIRIPRQQLVRALQKLDKRAYQCTVIGLTAHGPRQPIRATVDKLPGVELLIVERTPESQSVERIPEPKGPRLTARKPEKRRIPWPRPRQNRKVLARPISQPTPPSQDTPAQPGTLALHPKLTLTPRKAAEIVQHWPAIVEYAQTGTLARENGAKVRHYETCSVIEVGKRNKYTQYKAKIIADHEQQIRAYLKAKGA